MCDGFWVYMKAQSVWLPRLSVSRVVVLALGFGLWALGSGLLASGFGPWAVGCGLWASGFGLCALGFGLWGVGCGEQDHEHEHGQSSN